MRKFLFAMTRTLAIGYGKSNEYTEGQVKTTLKKLGYDGELEEIAIAIYCNEEIANQLGLDEALIKNTVDTPPTMVLGMVTVAQMVQEEGVEMEAVLINHLNSNNETPLSR
jgi:hypothetical protein